LETGAVVAVTLAATDEGDTATLQETVPQAGVNIAEAAGATAHGVGPKVELAGPLNVVGDKGYHSNEALTTLKGWEVRSYISEPERGASLLRRFSMDSGRRMASIKPLVEGHSIYSPSIAAIRV